MTPKRLAAFRDAPALGSPLRPPGTDAEHGRSVKSLFASGEGLAPDSQPNSQSAFLEGESALASLIRRYDWSATLGPVESWPQSLKSTVGLIVHSPVPMVLLWGVDGIMLYNDAYAVFAGGRHPQLLGSKVREGWPEVAEFNDNVMRVGLAGGVLSYKDQELTLYRSGRPEPVWMNLDYSPVFDETGRPGGVIAIVVETTERVITERRQAALSTRLRRQFDQAPGFVIIMTGPDHQVEFVNESHRRLFNSHGWEGLPIRRAFSSIEGQGFFEALDQVYATEETLQFDAAVVRFRRTEDGAFEDRRLTFIYAPIHDAAGQITGIFCQGVDVTARRQAEERLAASESRLRFLDELSRATLSSRDADEILAATTRRVVEHLVVSNCAYADMDPDEDGFSIRGDYAAPGSPSIVGHYSLSSFGRLAVDRLGAGEPLVVNDNLAELSPEAAAAFQSIGIAATICMPLVKDGRLTALMAIHDKVPHRWTREELSLIREVAERSWAHVERIGAEAELRASAAQLADLNDTLERRVHERTQQLMEAEAALRQAQKMEAVGQLTGGLAHDFNNLLMGIGGSLEMIERRMRESRLADAERFIAAGLQATERAASLTQRLLAFSRRQTLDPKPVDANALIQGMKDLIQRSVGPDVEIETKLSPEIWTTRVDPVQLESALLNLCINSRDAMAPDGGTVVIETQNVRLDEARAAKLDLVSGCYVRLSVQDAGAGMSPEVLNRVLEPFYTTKPLGQGTGLGLSMVYGFARQSGGQIRIVSQPGAGATVSLFLPQFVGVAEKEPGREASSTGIGRGQRVLVVDDEATVRRLIEEQLREGGYVISDASRASEALALLDSELEVDLLITDVGLPGGMNGRQLADLARVRRPRLKVLFITGYAESAVLDARGLDEDMGVLTKPFSLAQLDERVSEILGA